MSNKSTLVTLAAAMFAAMTPAVAADSNSEPMAMFYWQKPIGGSVKTADRAANYGFAVARVSEQYDFGSASKSPFAFLMGGQPAYMDVRFNDYGIQRLNINGLNALERQVVLNAADGTTEVVTQINWGYVVGGVLLGGFIIKVLDDDDECAQTPTLGYSDWRGWRSNIAIDPCNPPV